jgi:hypothetical protein
LAAPTLVYDVQLRPLPLLAQDQKAIQFRHFLFFFSFWNLHPLPMALPSPITMAFQTPRRAAGRAKFAVIAVVILCLLFYLRPSSSTTFSSAFRPIEAHLPSSISPQNPSRPGDKSTGKTKSKPSKHSHPIDTLIGTAEKTFDGLLKKESHDLKSAAAEYRRRRGRHPPPLFDLWYKFAEENGAVIVEDFFDQIYHDLGPFWGVAPAIMHKEAWDHEMTINIRNQTATAGSDWFWTQIWLDLMKTIQHMLPDMDLALNAMDEPRIVVPWEEINGYMEKERASRKMVHPKEVVSNFQPLTQHPDAEVEIAPKLWETKEGTSAYIYPEKGILH